METRFLNREESLKEPVSFVTFLQAIPSVRIIPSHFFSKIKLLVGRRKQKNKKHNAFF